ncbi:MAG: MYXO-CTERM sorting domain-containing protein [bacterium]
MHRIWAMAFAALLLPANGFAQSPNAVQVLFHGGQSSLYGIDLVDDVAVELGPRAITVEPEASLDMKLLPGGGVLLGQASGRGFAVYDAQQALVSLLDPTRRYREVSRVAVASYAAFGVPSRMLIGDSFSSVVTIRDLQTNQTVWYRSILNGNSFGKVAAVAALPDNQALVAARWDDLGISVIDIFDVSVIGDPLEIASQDYAAAPFDTVVVPEIAQIRDVFARPDGTLLVGTASRVVLLSPDRQLLKQLPLAMFGVSGEVASVRWTESGLVAFATYEPGAWTRPSESHRIHWWDPQTDAVYSSGSLTAAPAAIDAWAGHGGTGTENFLAGLDELALGNLSDIEAQAISLNQTTFVRGDEIRVRVVATNRGAFPVPTQGFRVDAANRRCDEAVDFTEDIGQGTPIIVYPAAVQEFNAVRVVDSRIPPGDWCVRATVSDESGALLELSPRLDVLVLDQGTMGTPLESTPLDFNEAPDMGDDMADMGPQREPGNDDGCGCSSANGLDASVLALFGLVLMTLRRRR